MAAGSHVDIDEGLEASQRKYMNQASTSSEEEERVEDKASHPPLSASEFFSSLSVLLRSSFCLCDPGLGKKLVPP